MANVGQITATTANQQMLPANPLRQAILIKNRQTNSDVVFINFGSASATTASSMPLNVGESLWLTALNGQIRASSLPDAVQVLANSATQDIRYIEF